MGILDKIFGPSPKKTLIEYRKIVAEVNDLEKEFAAKTDSQLRRQTDFLRERLKKGETLDDILPQAFAAVREASKRTIGQRHFDVQIIGGVVLHQGKIAEMKTGEGKTLAAVLPLYLNALEGKGAHLVTVNDFLAKFQGQWMGHIYNFLGMTTGVINHETSWQFSPQKQDGDDPTWNHLVPVSRKRAYNCDITYGTNNEFGFDYLRDNMVQSREQKVQRTLHYSIVDEIDSILIDEARTPLIISAPARESTSMYQQFAELVKKLKEEDYTLDEKDKAVGLTDRGIKKMEAWLGIKNLYDPNNVSQIHHIEEALKAEKLFHRNKDYVVKDGEIIIVDEFTGRLMKGRRYSEGLHQAIEAKEGVEVKRESETLATISFQNLFRLYNKLAGMTGTAATESEEFYKIYGLDVVVIPTNKPLIRIDHNDRIYKTEQAKFEAVVAEIKSRNEKGQPVLVGTISIEKNERLSKLLSKEGVKHYTLNAKRHEQEAKIIASAGKVGAVTLATNIAGRGVDIILGGAKPEEKKQKKDEKGNDVGLTTLVRQRTNLDEWEKEHQKVVKLGGLCVIGTERHEARRIDNQLRGRAGRQGDPGESVFFVSMEDDLMRIFGGERMKNIMQSLGLPDDMPIENKMISRSIESAQKKVEGHNFDIRKHLVEYDDVMNKHREAIYRKRNLILDFKGKVDEKVVELHEEIMSMLGEEEKRVYENKIKKYGLELIKQVEQQVYLRVIDQLWVDHLNAMEELRTGIGLRGYGQKDPMVEYKKESFLMFERLLDAVEAQLVDIILKLEIVGPPAAVSQKQDYVEQGARQEESGEVIREDEKELQQENNLPQKVKKKSDVEVKVRKKDEKKKAFFASADLASKKADVPKVGRNEPCPCGSGKKYKKCHGR